MLAFIRCPHRPSLAALTLLGLLGLAAPAAQAAPITIDDYSSSGSFGGAGVTLGAAPSTFNALDGPALGGVIGGANATRDTTLNFGAGLGSVNLTISGGDLMYTSTGTADGSFSLLYDANATLLANLIDMANNTLLVGVGSNTAGTPVTVTLVDDALNFFALTLLTTGGPGNLPFPLAGFIGVDLTQTQSILIGVDPPAGGSISLTGVVVTPEPTTAILWGFVSLTVLGHCWFHRPRPHR